MGNSFALPFSCCSFKPPATAHLCCFSAEPVTAYTCSAFLLIVAAHLPAYPHSLFRAAAKVMDAALISQPALHPSIHSSSLCVAGSEAPVLGSSPGSLTSLHKTRMVPHCFPPPHCPFSSPLLSATPNAIHSPHCPLHSPPSPPPLPFPLPCLQCIGSAFSPLSLFILGMSMADETEREGVQEARLGPLLTSLALVAAKGLLLPLLIVLPRRAWLGEGRGGGEGGGGRGGVALAESKITWYFCVPCLCHSQQLFYSPLFV